MGMYLENKFGSNCPPGVLHREPIRPRLFAVHQPAKGQTSFYAEVNS